MMLTSADFLAAVEAHLVATGTKPTRFGKDVLGDPNFVRDLREGRNVTLDVLNKVLSFIAERKPAAEVAA